MARYLKGGAAIDSTQADMQHPAPDLSQLSGFDSQQDVGVHGPGTPATQDSAVAMSPDSMLDDFEAMQRRNLRATQASVHLNVCVSFSH